MAKKDKKSKKDKSKKAEKEAPKKNKGSSDSQVVRKLDGSIALSKLVHVIMEKKGKKTKKVRGIFIPFKQNFIEENESGAIYLGVRVNLKDKEDQFNQHGFISQSVNSAVYKAASEEEKEAMKKTPILGGLKDWEFTSTSNDSSGAATSKPVDENDDLPF